MMHRDSDQEHNPVNISQGGVFMNTRRAGTKNNQILEFIRKYYMEHGYGPSVREICASTDLTSTSTVHGHITRLTKYGLITHDPRIPHSIVPVKETA